MLRGEVSELSPARERLEEQADFNRPAGISNPGLDGYGSGYGGTQIGLLGQKNLHQIGGRQNTSGMSGGWSLARFLNRYRRPERGL